MWVCQSFEHNLGYTLHLTQPPNVAPASDKLGLGRLGRRRRLV